VPEVLDLRELGGGDEHGRPRGGPRAPIRVGQPVEGDVDDDVDVDDELDPTVPAAGAMPPWRRRVGVGLVLLLALGVAYVLSAVRPSTSPSRPPANLEPPVERAARAALDAWARFASTGDLDALAVSFDPAGPQMARLRWEAASMPGRLDPSYAFSLRGLSASTGRNQDEQVVRVDVVLSRSVEADQVFAWELVMRRAGRESPWLLWTVRDRATTSTTTGGAP
jgi:hypothetical protein